MHAIPIDHVRNTHQANLPTVVLDLADRDQTQIVLNLMEVGYADVTHSGVPCGTR